MSAHKKKKKQEKHMFSKLIMAKNARKQHKYADCPD